MPDPFLAPLTVELIGTAIAGGLTAGTQHIRTQRQSAFSDEVTSLADRFNAALRDSVQAVADEQGIDELDTVSDNWEWVARKLNDKEFAFKKEEEAINEIAKAILHVEGLDTGTYRHTQRRVKSAVADAYDDAIKGFAERLNGELANEFLVLANIEQARTLDEVNERLEKTRSLLDSLVQQYSAFQYYEVFDCSDEYLPKVIEILGDWDRQEERYIDFISPSDLDGHPASDKLLILAQRGRGKTRSLIELLRRYDDLLC